MTSPRTDGSDFDMVKFAHELFGYAAPQRIVEEVGAPPPAAVAAPPATRERAE